MPINELASLVIPERPSKADALDALDRLEALYSELDDSYNFAVVRRFVESAPADAP